MIPDPLFLIFIGIFLIFSILKKDRLIDLFGGIEPGKQAYDSDYLYIILITTFTYYPVYLLVSSVFPPTLIEFDFVGLYVYFTLPTLIVGILYTIAYAPLWYNTLRGDGSKAVLGLLVAVMFGAFFATYLATGLNPESDTIRDAFGYYVDVALDILRLISMMAVLPIIQRVIEYAYQIFKTNIAVAFRGALFSLAGGIFGVGTLLAMIPLFTTATVAGIFGGILLRNNIDNVFAPVLALIAVLGVPPFWHTFYEFMAFGLISASVGMLVYSVVTKQERRLKYSASGVVVGALVLLFGAFNEVTVSSSIAGWIKNTLSFAPVITDITVNATYVINFVITFAVVFAVAILVAYAIEVVIKFVEEVTV